MRQVLARIGITSLNKLGRCGYCMRASFVVAAVAWLAAIAAAMVFDQTIVTGAMVLAASAFSLLWLAHLTAYSLRSARCKVSTATIDASGKVFRYNRRDLAPLFARAFAFAAVGSLSPILAVRAVAADEGCTDETPAACGTQYCCSAPSLWHCSGYTGYVQNWRAMGSFCTNENSDEDVADLRANCAELVQC